MQETLTRLNVSNIRLYFLMLCAGRHAQKAVLGPGSLKSRLESAGYSVKVSRQNLGLVLAPCFFALPSEIHPIHPKAGTDLPYRFTATGP